MINRYRNSNKLLQEALKYIPLGSQTFSKSITQYPRNVSPFFMEKAKGASTWDVDGNEYIDFVNALCCVNIGHCDEDITNAVKKQLELGTIFSLPHTLELDVAKLIVEHVPCAEMVRFAKNGSDATSAAVRIARAFTGKEKIVKCGYHGWHDWYIGATTRNKGIPECVSDLTLSFEYNNIESLHKIFKENPNEIAAIIMEPMNVEFPKDDFLHKVKELCHKNGALFVLDEVITGFRFALGGAQELFNIIPDLCSLGKGMANGYPLSAIVGAEKYMKECENIFFSGTFGGECLSLAAAKATINKIKTQNVAEHTTKIGQYLIDEFNKLIQQLDLKWISISGHPTWSIMSFKDYQKYSSFEIKTLFMQEIFANQSLLTRSFVWLVAWLYQSIFIVWCFWALNSMTMSIRPII